jgi:SAM-dependent methyltransferase
MCGSGQTTEYLLSRGARVTSLDISAESIAALQRKWPDCAGVIASILESGFERDAFDCVVIVGGLHHLHPRLEDGLDEIHRILKPGGFFCFLEPHAESLPDLVRNRWYKRDPLFEKNEAAIDIDALMAKNRDRFHFRKMRYGGSVAYLLVLQSMVFRVPLRWKRLYAPLLMALESAINPLMNKRLACFAIGQWQKR